MKKIYCLHYSFEDSGDFCPRYQEIEAETDIDAVQQAIKMLEGVNDSLAIRAFYAEEHDLSELVIQPIQKSYLENQKIIQDKLDAEIKKNELEQLAKLKAKYPDESS